MTTPRTDGESDDNAMPNLEVPSQSYGVSQVYTGALIQPLRRLKAMESGEWEEFVEEWIHSLKITGTYHDVHRFGGAGDCGRDVVGFKGAIGSGCCWDNYQCKYYKDPLGVATIVSEVGKVLYYISIGEITPPDLYSFVSPRGPSTALIKCLEKQSLKSELITRWDQECLTQITSLHEVKLAEVRAQIEAFDFMTVRVLSPLDVIEGLRKTPHFATRFGGGLAPRRLPGSPPLKVLPEEAGYIGKLLLAYGEEKGRSFAAVAELAAHSLDLSGHLDRSRQQFFYAESLRAFSRDTVPEGTFEALQEEIHDGIQDTYKDDYSSGYIRVKATVAAARNMQITGNALIGALHTNDRAGICHQLANDDRLEWVQKGSQP